MPYVVGSEYKQFYFTFYTGEPLPDSARNSWAAMNKNGYIDKIDDVYKNGSSTGSLDLREGGSDNLQWVKASNAVRIMTNNIVAPIFYDGKSGLNPPTWNHSFSQLGVEDAPVSDVGKDGESASKLFFWSKNVTIDGAAYKIRPVVPGSSDNEFNNGDFGKYIIPLGKGANFWRVGEECTGIWDGRWNVSPESSSAYGTVSYANWDGNKFYRYQGRKKPGYYTSDACATFRLIAVPTSPAIVFSADNTNLGGLLAPTTLTVGTSAAGKVNVEIDGDIKGNVTSTTTNVSVNLADYWDDLSYGAHSVRLIGTLNNYDTECKATFEKRASGILIVGNPLAVGKMPLACTVVDNSIVPSGAVKTISVCNNGNDVAPTWEEYEGTSHRFTNQQKTDDSWALNWKIDIDNTNGQTNAEVHDAVAMGVLY